MDWSARVMGGWGLTTSSCHITAILIGWCGENLIDGFQDIGIRAGSDSHGFVSIIVFIKALIPPMLVLNGPMTVATASAPAAIDDQPSVGIRKAVGLSPYRPLLAAGLRILPVINK